MSAGDISDAFGLALQGDGKIVMSVGFQDDATGELDVFLARLGSSGALDAGYGIGGLGDVSGLAGSYLGSLSPVVLDGNGDAIHSAFTQYASGDLAVVLGRWCGD